MNENINSLMTAYPLDRLTVSLVDSSNMQDRINKLPTNGNAPESAISGSYMTCFVMRLNDKPQTDGQSQDGTPKETFCLETQKAAINWIIAIDRFRSCELRVLQATETMDEFQNTSTVQTFARNETNNFVKMRVEKFQKINEINQDEQTAFKDIVTQQSESRNSYLKDAIEQFKKQQEYYKQQMEIEEASKQSSVEETESSIQQIDCLLNQESKDVAMRDRDNVLK